MVRDYTKWDDAPVSLAHFAESAVRAYKVAMTPPYAPVVIVADAAHAGRAIPAAIADACVCRSSSLTTPPAADAGAVAEVARMLVAADNPVIMTGRAARTPKGIALLVELAELLQAPVNDGHQFTLRMNFPTRHPLKGAGVVAGADLLLALEIPDLFQATHASTPVNRLGMESRPTMKPGAKIVTISSSDLLTKNNYQDAGRYTEADLAIPADAEATLPQLIEACRQLITPDRRRAMDARGAKLAEASQQLREKALEQAAWGWDASPISTARLSAELWNRQGRGLVARERHVVHQQLAAEAVGFHEALPVHRLVRRRTASATERRRPSAPRWRTGSTAG